MLIQNRSHWLVSAEATISSTVTSIEEGQAMNSLLENGVEVAGFVSSAANTDLFAGFALGGFKQPTQNNLVVSTTIPASSPYTVTLPKTPSANADISVRTATGTAFTQGTVATTVYSVSGSTLTFASADAGVAIIITFKYNLSAKEADTLFGDERYRRGGSLITNTISLIKSGTVFTTNFATGVNWNARPTPVVGANGIITTTTGAAIGNGRVVFVPTVDEPYLGISFAIA